METKKYEFTEEVTTWNGHRLHRIKALRDFGNIKVGDLGGWIEKEANLSNEGNCWVDNDAKVYDNAMVKGNAEVFGHAVVYDNAVVFDDAKVYDNAMVNGRAMVYDKVMVCDNAVVCGHAIVCEDVVVCGNACVSGNALVSDKAQVYGDAQVGGNAKVSDKAKVYGNAQVSGYASVHGNAVICGDAVIKETKDYAVFKNTWSSGRFFTWTRSNDKWQVGCFRGTGEELIAKAYADSKLSGKCYEAIVQAQNRIKELLK